jgi:F-type H+-transporting ATPase subunit delta
MTAGVAGRYAVALFALAEEQHALDAVCGDLGGLAEAISDSAELRAALSDASVPRAEMVKAVEALGAALAIGPLTQNFVKLMASKRRLAHLPGAISAFEALMAEKRGEITAEAVSAAPLSDEQVDVLRDAAVHATGKSVQMKLDVNPDLIGGVILKIGSRMIDASVRSKLAVLQQRMKEVG